MSVGEANAVIFIDIHLGAPSCFYSICYLVSASREKVEGS